MSSIVKQKVGNNIYLYESVSFRNKEGQPRNTRIIIGKIEAGTGQPVYKKEYLDRMAAEGHPVPITQTPSSFTVNDIHRSSICDFGAFYLYKELAKKMGLLDALQKAFPGLWSEIFNLAAYLVSTRTKVRENRIAIVRIGLKTPMPFR